MQDEIENTDATEESDAVDPAAPSVEPSHGVAPAQTVPDAPADEGRDDLDDSENDDIEEPDTESE